MATSGSRATVALVLRGPLARGDLSGLCDRLCALLRVSGATSARCDVRGVEPNAVTVDLLARLQLEARRSGSRVALEGASRELLDLVALMGLADVLPEDEGFRHARA